MMGAAMSPEPPHASRLLADPRRSGRRRTLRGPLRGLAAATLIGISTTAALLPARGQSGPLVLQPQVEAPETAPPSATSPATQARPRSSRPPAAGTAGAGAQGRAPAPAPAPALAPPLPTSGVRPVQGLPTRVEGMNPAAPASRAAPAARPAPTPIRPPQPALGVAPPRPPRVAPPPAAARAPAAKPAAGTSSPAAGTIAPAAAAPTATSLPASPPVPVPMPVPEAATPAARTVAPPARSAAPKATSPAPVAAAGPAPVVEPPPPLRAPDLTAVLVFVDPAPAARRSPQLLPADARAIGAGPIPIRLARPPRPLYVSDILAAPRIPVFDTMLQPADPVEAAPVALNSFDAMKIGIPAGPYRAGLIEEMEADPDRPKIQPGTVSWKVIPGSEPGPDAPPSALVADIEMDSAGLKARFTMRPVREPGAAPTIAFDLTLSGPQAQVAQIGLPELRNIGVDRGIPLFGSIVPGGDAFTVLLARDQVDGEQNVRLLTGRPWIDIPVRLQDGRRMTIAFEKGTAVRDMMRNALRLWRMPWLP